MHELTTTNLNVTFKVCLFPVAASMKPNNYLNIILVFLNPSSSLPTPTLQLNTINSTLPPPISVTSPATQLYQTPHPYSSPNSYSLTPFPNTLPLSIVLSGLGTASFDYSFSQKPDSSSNLTIVFSYVLIQRVFVAGSVLILYEGITVSTRDYYLEIDQNGFMDCKEETCFLGIVGVGYKGASLIMSRLINYQAMYNNKKHIKLGYLPTGSNITYLASTYLLFNPTYTCSYQQTITHPPNIYHQVPSSCISCHQTCQQCVTSDNDYRYTDQRFCTVCPIDRELKSNDKRYSECVCLKGLEQVNGVCMPCQFACLQFNVYFMRSSTQANFLLVFTFAQLNHQIKIQQNLVIYIDSKKVIPQSLTNTKPGVYKITLSPEQMQPCSQTCITSFKFLKPYLITTPTSPDPTYLTKQIFNLSISDYFFAEKRLPKQLTQAFSISSTIITFSSSAGQASLIKMLFQLEQIIDVHKYLNLELPIVFKEFVEAVSVFRFMDLTTIISYDINKDIKSISGDDLDCKGSPKIIYYQNGVNFYKNMTPVILSLLIMLVINFLLFLFFRLIPIRLSQTISQKLRIRWLITISDNIESMLIPLSLFLFFQLSYMPPIGKYIWIYCIGHLALIGLFLFPFVVVSQIRCFMATRGEGKVGDEEFGVMVEVYEDVLQDCSINYRITYMYYLYNYLRKFLYTPILASSLPGVFQSLMLIALNLPQLYMTGYMIFHKIFKSKPKMLCRTLNLLNLIILQILILFYNMGYNSFESKILVGTTCTYLSIISTGLGVIELFIKLGEIIFQRIMKNKSNAKVKGKGVRKVESGEHVDEESVQEEANGSHGRLDQFVKNVDGKRVGCNIQVDKKNNILIYDEDSQEDDDDQKQYEIVPKKPQQIKKLNQYKQNPKWINEQQISDNSQIHYIQSSFSGRYPQQIEVLNKNKQTIVHNTDLHQRPKKRENKNKSPIKTPQHLLSPRFAYNYANPNDLYRNNLDSVDTTDSNQKNVEADSLYRRSDRQRNRNRERVRDEKERGKQRYKESIDQKVMKRKPDILIEKTVKPNAEQDSCMSDIVHIEQEQ